MVVWALVIGNSNKTFNNARNCACVFNTYFYFKITIFFFCRNKLNFKIGVRKTKTKGISRLNTEGVKIAVADIDAFRVIVIRDVPVVV